MTTKFVCTAQIFPQDRGQVLPACARSRLEIDGTDKTCPDWVDIPSHAV